MNPPSSSQTSMHQRSWVVAVALVLVPVAGSAMANPALASTQVAIATQLSEVQRGTFDGRDYLTLHIGGHDVGPSSCRSNKLRMDTGSATGATAGCQPVCGWQANVHRSLPGAAQLLKNLLIDGHIPLQGQPEHTHVSATENQVEPVGDQLFGVAAREVQS